MTASVTPIYRDDDDTPDTARSGVVRGRLYELRPELLIFCGIVGFFGNVGPIIAMILSVPVAAHDFVADTISDLARGPHAWIMDTGFYIGAAGMLALSIAAAHYHLGRWAWSASVFCLAFLALIITLLGVWDNITPEGDGTTVHTKLTFALGPLYFFGPLLMTRAVTPIGRGLAIAFAASACLWLVFAIAFKLAPDNIDGLFEKVAVAATLIWTLPLSVLFWRRGRREMT